MGYPLRTDEHVKETASVKALLRCLPDPWLMRHLTERDYGIDSIIEIPTKTDTGYQLTGQFFGVQLKYDSTLQWREDEKFGQKATISGIATTTARYWFGLPFPTFLCIHDQHTGHLYFAPAKKQIRKQYAELQSQKSMSFYITQDTCLDTPLGLAIFLNLYVLEVAHINLTQTIKDFLIHHEQYIKFVRKHLNRDVHLELDYLDELLLFDLYEKCRTIIACRMVRTPLITDREIFEHDKKAFPGTNHIHEYTAAWALNLLMPVFIDILKIQIPEVIQSEEPYWQRTEPLLYRTYMAEWSTQAITYMIEDLERQR